MKFDPGQLNGAEDDSKIWRRLRVSDYDSELLFLVLRWGDKNGSLVLRSLAAAALIGMCPAPSLVVLLPSGMLVECSLVAHIDQLFNWDSSEAGDALDERMRENPIGQLYVRLGTELVRYSLATST